MNDTVCRKPAFMEAAPGITIGCPSNTEPICRVSGYLQPLEANARLIAASPGLLEALKELLHVAKVRTCGCYVCDESIKAAEKAIAQAQEGKPNENV